MAKNLPNLKPGDIVAGRFRIVEIIGSGGFSVVYRAHQEGMNRFVALKVLKPKASHDAKIVERFRREALYASHLSHPNTITLFDYGHTENGLCYIAMEYLSGMDLSAVVQTHISMDLKRVWKVLVQTNRSLAEAHRLGLVHRDLKPENIYLCQREDGEFVKVLDFGVSKAISEFGDAGPTTLAPLTQEGTVFGTPLYMAPEQAMAESISPAVDVYAMGHIAFEMITGHAAYEQCNNAMDVMLRQINDPPLALPAPWSESPFSSLITKCTQKDPAHRVSDAAEMLEILLDPEFEAFMDPGERPARKPSLPRAPAVSVRDTDLDLSQAEAEEVYRWELEMLDEALQECRTQGEPRLVIVRGRPGTGRSNLLRAFVQKSLQDASLFILHRSLDGEGAGLEQELSALTGIKLRGNGISEVKRILVQIFGKDDELTQSADELGTDSSPLNTLSSVRENMLSRIAEPFRNRAEHGPLVWGIESLESLDTLSLAFLDRFFRELQAHPAPVMLVVTVYPEDLKRRPGLVRYTQGMLQAGRPLARQLSLVPPGESKQDEHEQVDTKLAHVPDNFPANGSYLGVPPEVLEDEDYVRQAAHTDRLATVDSPDAVGGAFDQVLGYLAQLGDDVPVELWKLVYARILNTELIRLVDSIINQAEKFGIIARGPSSLRFTQAGFAKMLRESFDAFPDAAESHRKLADLMIQFYPSPDPQQVSIIVRHLTACGEVGRGVEILFKAGEETFQELDLDAAREYYLQIQKLLDSHPGADAKLKLNKGRLWLRLGEIHGALGEHGAAEDALDQALRKSDSNDKEVQGKAHKLLGDLAVSQDRYSDALRYFEKSRDAYRNLGLARPFVAITSEMGCCALLQGRSSLAEDLSRQALEMAHKLKDNTLIARVNRHLGQVLTRRGRFIEAMEHLEESMRGFEAAQRGAEVVGCLTELGNAAFASGRYADSRDHFTRAIATSSSHHLGSAVEPHLGLARALAADGNLEQAHAHLAEALARSGTSRDLVRMAEVYLYQGDLQLAAHEHTLARKYYEEVVDIAETIGQMKLWIDAVTRLAYVELDRGHEDKTFAELGRAMARSNEIGDEESELQTRAHIIYIQMLLHGFPATGETFSTVLDSGDDAQMNAATVLSYLFRSDVAAARKNYSEARDYLRYAHVAAAQFGDFAIFIPIARRGYLLQKQIGQLGDAHVGSGHAIGAILPPEVGVRRRNALPIIGEN